jgi:hypothetical protein
MMSFDEDLDAQLILAAAPDHVDLPAVVNGTLYTFRIFAMDGLEWSEITDMFPARQDVLLDQRYGYNLRPLSKFAVRRCGKLVDGDNLIDLTDEQWDKLFSGLPGATVMRIGDVIWNLNEYLPGQAIEALKKGSAAKSARNSKLPKPAGSPVEG